MSWLSKYVFDPVKAALARAEGSSNAGVAAAAKAASDSLNSTAAQVGTDLSQGLTANSAVALKNDVVKGLEDGLKLAVDAYLTAAVPLGLGAAAVPVANAAIDFAESHALAYVSSLFSHAKGQVAATVSPAPAASTPAA
jgi:hypothetical protein